MNVSIIKNKWIGGQKVCIKSHVVHDCGLNLTLNAVVLGGGIHQEMSRLEGCVLKEELMLL